jgi:hypothetical protein
MAGDHAAVAQEMSVGARIGGPSTVVTLVSVAHAFSHAYGALLPKNSRQRDLRCRCPGAACRWIMGRDLS